MRVVLTLFPAVLALWLYRSRVTLVNSILTKPDLPAGYYYAGNYSTQCFKLKDETEDDALKYCEDAVLWDLHDSAGVLEERRLIISCDAGRKEWNTVMGPLAIPGPHGSLWMYSPKTRKVERVTLENYPKGHNFHPLGVEVYPSYSGNSSYLYAVNHAQNRTYIEQFILSPSAPVAKHLRTISSPYFVSPNALALTSPTSFYVTNDHFFTRRLPLLGHILPFLETIIGLPFSWASHVVLNPDLTSPAQVLSHTFVAPFISFANGIAISPSGTQVAIASTSISQIFFYTRNITTNTLSYTGSVQTPFCADNILFDSAEDLIVAGHPHFPALTQVAAGKATLAPSWVISISPREPDAGVSKEFDMQAPLSSSRKIQPSQTHSLQTLFQSNGEAFSSSSTGLRDSQSGNLYISGLYAEQGVVVCEP